MPYPRQLVFDEETEERINKTLYNWLIDHQSERGDYEDQLLAWQEDYNAEPMDDDKNFPFQNSCKIIIPLTAIAVETVHANVMGTLYALDQFISAKPTNPIASNFAPVFERFANEQLIKHIKIDKQLESSYLEIEKFGTGVARADHCEVIKYGVREQDGVEVTFPVTVKNSVEILATPVARFWMPYNDLDPQMAEWCGETRDFTRMQIKNGVRAGLFREDVEELLETYFWNSATSENSREFEDAQEEYEARQSSWPKELTLHEIWCSLNVTDDEDEPEREVQIFYHLDSRTICGVMYNQRPSLSRPYRTGNYIKVEHRWAGIGICKQNEQFQLEITIQHRQRIDNATIANIRMFKVAKMSGYGPKEPIFPGKMWFLDDMEDIEPMQLGEIYPSAYNNENQALLYSQQRTKVNELIQGMPQVGTPGTATSDLARIQAAKRGIDYVTNNIKDFTLEVALDCLDLIKIYGIRHSSIKFNPTDAQIIDAIMTQPFESFREGAFFDIKLVGTQSNKLLDRQNWQQVAGHITQYFTQMIELMMNTGQQDLAQIFITKAITGGTEAMRQILETFDIPGIERILPIQEIQEYMNGGNQLPQQAGNPGVAGAPPNRQLGNPNVPA